MRFVAALTRLMARHCRGQLLLVTAATRCCLRPAVWLVTTDALSVTLAHLGALRRVTGLTASHRQLRMVRKPDMATHTSLVSGSMGRTGQLRRMATLTSPVVGERPDEVVGCVTALALDARVKRRVLVRGLVARAAVARARLGVAKAGVRVVTTDARACLAFLGMIRLLGRVTLGAGLVGTALDIVGTVTAGAPARGPDSASKPARDSCGKARPSPWRIRAGDGSPRIPCARPRTGRSQE